MLTQQQVDNLLFHNHHHFDSEEVLSQYTREELDNILIHLENLLEKYFKRIMELHNDPYERSDKATARDVMNNAYNKVYKHYLTKYTTIITEKKTSVSYPMYIIGIFICIIGILLYFII